MIDHIVDAYTRRAALNRHISLQQWCTYFYSIEILIFQSLASLFTPHVSLQFSGDALTCPPPRDIHPNDHSHRKNTHCGANNRYVWSSEYERAVPRNAIAQWVSRNFQHQQNGASAFTSTLDVLPTSIASIRCNFVLSRPDLRPQRIRECHWNQSVTLVLPPFYRFYDFFLMGGSYLKVYRLLLN